MFDFKYKHLIIYLFLSIFFFGFNLDNVSASSSNGIYFDTCYDSEMTLNDVYSLYPSGYSSSEYPYFILTVYRTNDGNTVNYGMYVYKELSNFNFSTNNNGYYYVQPNEDSVGFEVSRFGCSNGLNDTEEEMSLIPYVFNWSTTRLWANLGNWNNYLFTFNTNERFNNKYDYIVNDIPLNGVQYPRFLASNFDIKDNNDTVLISSTFSSSDPEPEPEPEPPTTNDILTDTTIPTFNDIFGGVSPISDGVISDLITVPITMLNIAYLNSDTCSSFDVPFLNNNNLHFNCFTISDYLGENVSHIIDIFIVFGIIYTIAPVVVTLFEEVTTFKDTWTTLYYVPQHAAQPYTPKHGGDN